MVPLTAFFVAIRDNLLVGSHVISSFPQAVSETPYLIAPMVPAIGLEKSSITRCNFFFPLLKMTMIMEMGETFL